MRMGSEAATPPTLIRDSDGKCGFGGRDVARNVSTTA
jgi:hypothetical protein